MDIVTHILSGIAVGTVIASFSAKGTKVKLKVIGFSGFGGAFPDFDAISLWSGFDKTFGKLFGLNDSGKTIYFSKYWYSHHGFFHSIFASLIFALTIGLILYLIQSRIGNKGKETIQDSFKNNSLILIGFIAGFILHLLEDMPTPGCVWGGVRLLWPLRPYVGGTGEIWWWNNYDIFIIVFGLIIINGLVLSMQRYISFDKKKLTVMFFLIGLTLCIVQIKRRSYDFNYVGQTSKFQQYEQKSKDIQQKILGGKLYGLMVSFDKKIRVNF